MKTFTSLLSSALILALVGCGPRGETKSLDEILTIAKSSVNSASLSVVPDASRTIVQNLVKQLDTLAGSPDSGAAARSASAEIASLLSQVVAKSGYTSRPGMTELMHQWDSIGQDASKLPAAGTIKLLTARTYTLIASELQSAKFAL